MSRGSPQFSEIALQKLRRHVEIGELSLKPRQPCSTEFGERVVIARSEATKQSPGIWIASLAMTQAFAIPEAIQPGMHSPAISLWTSPLKETGGTSSSGGPPVGTCR